MITVKLQSVSGSVYFPTVKYQLVDSIGYVFARDMCKDDAEAVAALWNKPTEVKPPTIPIVRVGQVWRDNEVVYNSTRPVRVIKIVEGILTHQTYVQVIVTTAGVNPNSGRWHKVGIRGSIHIKKFLREYHLITEAVPLPGGSATVDSGPRTAYATSCASGSGVAPTWGDLGMCFAQPPTKVEYVYRPDRRLNKLERRSSWQSTDRRKS